MPNLRVAFCLLAVACLAPQPLIAACPNFAAAVNYPGGDNPGSVAVGDFNGDGKPDLATATIQSNDVRVRLNNGNGSFGAAVVLTLATSSVPTGIVTADFNRDGKADLATSNGGTNKVSIFIGNGLGGFAAAVDYDAHTQPFGLAVGDFDRDDIPDLVVANYQSNDASVLLGNGDGTFAAKVDYTNAPIPGNLSFVATGDFNLDGALDFVVTNQRGSNITVRFGVGDGTFPSWSNFTVGTNPTSVAVGDFDRDGNPDLAVANTTSQDVSILKGYGISGFFSLIHTYPAGPFATAGDFNGDGKIDLAIGDATDTVSVLIGDGNGAFAPKIAYAVGIGSPGQLAAADFNSDGRTDLAVTNQTADSVSIKMNSGTCSANCGSFAATVDYQAAQTPLAAVVADFNGDGHSDVATSDPSGYIAVLYGNGSTMGSLTQFAAGSGAKSMVVADFNRDGKPDMAVANQTANSFSILRAFGIGFTTLDNPLTFTPYSIASGDFDRDGDPDLAIADPGSNSVYITLHDNSGNFLPGTAYATATGATGAFGIATGDLNADGKLDLAVANETSNNVTVMMGDGAGSFTSGANYGVGTSPRSIAIGDFNRDGKLDLAVTNYGTTTVSILLANGVGTFAAAVDYTVGSNPESVAAGDFDVDGTIDLAVANQGSDNVSILRGIGNGTFAAAVNHGVGDEPHAVAIGDFNRDGSPDVVTANGVSGTISIVANTCPYADLTITNTASFGFAQSQFSRYVITVTNLGTGPTSGAVTVTEQLPAYVKVRLISGSGWTCNKATITCTTSDALAGASSYSPIEVNFIMPSNAPASITAVASVSGGSDINPDNNTDTEQTPVPVTVLGAPTNLTATAVSTSQIDITWDASTNAQTYRLSRSADNSVWTVIGNPTTTAFSDMSRLANTTYVYEVLAVDASSTAGDPGRRDLATTIFFIDDPDSLTAWSLAGGRIEAGDLGDKGREREWLARAVRAPRDRAATCLPTPNSTSNKGRCWKTKAWP